MAELVDLGLLRAVTRGLAVADADGDDAAEEVEVALAVDVPDVLHLAALDGEGIGEVVGDGREDVFLLLAVDLLAGEASSFGGNRGSAHDGVTSDVKANMINLLPRCCGTEESVGQVSLVDRRWSLVVSLWSLIVVSKCYS